MVLRRGRLAHAAFSSSSFTVGGVNISVQSLLVVGTSLVLIGALGLFFGRTFYGKALRATAVKSRGGRDCAESRLTSRVH